MILVTGGTGFVGKPLVKKLRSKGENVIVFSRNEDKELKKMGVKFVIGDIRNKSDFRKLKKYNIDIVYHLAAVLDEKSDELFDVNVNGTKNVVDFCLEKNARLIFLSPIGVLGPVLIPARETFPYNPQTKYEKSKMVAEKIITSTADLDYIIVRSSIILGPNKIWMQILDAVKKGYPIIGNGENYFHLTALEDVVDFLFFIKKKSLKSKTRNQIFHIATKDALRYKEFYKMVCEKLGCEMTNKKISVTTAKIISFLNLILCKLMRKEQKITHRIESIKRLVRNRIISTEKIESLGFKPSTTEEALDKTIKALFKKE